MSFSSFFNKGLLSSRRFNHRIVTFLLFPILTAISAGGADLSLPSLSLAGTSREIPFLYVETTPHQAFDLGDKLAVKVKLTREDGITPLSGRKVTVALNGENGLRQVVPVGTDGTGTAEFTLRNQVDSSCCVLGKREIPNPYGVIAIFPGDSSYARQEVVAFMGMRGSGGQKTKIDYSAPNLVIHDGKVQVSNVAIKLASGATVATNASLCVDKYCASGSSTITLDVSPLPRGSYAAVLSYGGHGALQYSAVVTSFGVFLNNPMGTEQLPLKGLYKGWDYDNARPEDLKDRTGRPMNFDGVSEVFWMDIFDNMEKMASKIKNTPVKITLSDGSQRYKRFIVGLSPLSFGDPPISVAPLKYSFKTIPLANCPKVDCKTYPTICQRPKEMPDFKDPAWQDAFKDGLMAIADWWKSRPDYQDIIVAVRVGGGFDGEWGNGPDKNGCSTADMLAYYKETREQFMYFWGALEEKAIQWASEASLRSRMPNGKQLYFIFEDYPHASGRMAEPSVGYKFNAVDVMGLQIFMPPICAGPCHEKGIGYYPRLYPGHFGGLETRYGHYGYGCWPFQPEGARAAGAYWNSLLALKAQPTFFDFHGNYWEGYQYLAGLDLFMQAHLQNQCDGVDNGFIAFREVANGYRKEAPPCGKATTPRCDPGTENFNDTGVTLDYGDVDICLYAPRVPGVQFEPVRNDYFRGAVQNAYGQNVYTKAWGQHYLTAGYPNAYQSRKLVSPYAYLDIDEGITSRVGSKWEIKVVYYDGHPGEVDTFSLDYYNTGGSLKSLVIQKQGTEVFKEALWIIDDLRTDNLFPEASADLRLNNRGDGPDIFHSVSVKAIQGGADGAPAPPQNFSVTLGQ